MLTAKQERKFAAAILVVLVIEVLFFVGLINNWKKSAKLEASPSYPHPVDRVRLTGYGGFTLYLVTIGEERYLVNSNGGIQFHSVISTDKEDEDGTNNQ